jgi:hypothetical protein
MPGMTEHNMSAPRKTTAGRSAATGMARILLYITYHFLPEARADF